jgi:hypothetical protein
MKHVLIVGTGRAGTSLLVKILTRLGYDTGFNEEDLLMGVDSISNAGLEFPWDSAVRPKVLKSPVLWGDPEAFLRTNSGDIEHVIIPIRDLHESSRSRIRVQELNVATGVATWEDGVPGGLTKFATPDNQEVILARRVFLIIRTLNEIDVPYSFVNFPEFAKDHMYLYRYLKTIFPRLKRKNLLRVAEDTCKPELIHTFS